MYVTHKPYKVTVAEKGQSCEDRQASVHAEICVCVCVLVCVLTCSCEHVCMRA